MASVSQFRSLGRFLYTQNPFYLISCFLILYGLQIATIAGHDLLSRSLFLSISIAGYTLLMAITCVGVIRLGKVWEDARSIFLVVIISLVALSSALDELSITQWNVAAPLLALGGTFAVIITEFVLRSCRLRLPSWYRLSFYALLSIFFAMPAALGNGVSERQLMLTNWGAPLFSTLIAAGLLLLAPAMRKGELLVADNGTPWRWPWYPLTAFGILIVLAGIRTHAIWMSFGYIGAPVRFEPFLLLPIALAILVLTVASDDRSKATTRSYVAMGIAPMLLVCAVSRDGMTHLPIQADLQMYFGSARTIALVALLGFYFYVWVRGVAGSELAVTVTLLGLCGLSDLPTIAQSAGFMHWMYAALATICTLAICLRNPKSDRNWLGFTMVTVLTILTAGQAYDQMFESAISAAIFAMIAMMMIGACFETRLAQVLRHVAAIFSVAAAFAVVLWHINVSPGMISFGILAGLSALSIAYMQLVKRLGWLYVFAIEATCLIGLYGWTTYESGSLAQTNWPIQTGMLCFVIGVTITSFKTGIHRRLRRQLPQSPDLRQYHGGL